jgi:hypothetical protein
MSINISHEFCLWAFPNLCKKIKKKIKINKE